MRTAGQFRELVEPLLAQIDSIDPPVTAAGEQRREAVVGEAAAVGASPPLLLVTAVFSLALAWLEVQLLRAAAKAREAASPASVEEASRPELAA